MRGGLDHRGGAGKRTFRIHKVRGRINRSADFAAVTVLVLGAALRTRALDVAVGEEHPFFGVVELFDVFGVDKAGGLESAVDVLA